MRWMNIGGSGSRKIGDYVDGDGPGYLRNDIITTFGNRIVLQATTPDGDRYIHLYGFATEHIVNCTVACNIIPGVENIGSNPRRQGPQRTLVENQSLPSGGMLVMSWNADIIYGYNRNDPSIPPLMFNAVRQSLYDYISDILPISFDGFGAPARQVRRPGWVTCTAATGSVSRASGGFSPSTWVSIYTTGSANRGDTCRAGGSDLFYIFPRVEARVDSELKLIPGGYCDEMDRPGFGMSSVFPTYDGQPFMPLFGKYGDVYYADNIVQYFKKYGDFYQIPVYHYIRGNGQQCIDFAQQASVTSGLCGRVGASYVTPIDRSDIVRLCDAGRIYVVNTARLPDYTGVKWDGTISQIVRESNK